jgi:8-oxo-dGTP pyrophosphatase MutT (NUDIX family)
VGSRAISPHSSRFSASSALALCGRQQVAAVCYRISPRGPEFLLVRTRGGRWIFPKGGVQHGLTHAQSAALEAFEEAGVHGRMEEVPFTRYRHSKAKEAFHRSGRKLKTEPVIAHLCEVSRLERPQEAKRKPTWFSPEKAKKRLLEDRDQEFGTELAAVVDRAVSRIRRLETASAQLKQDELQQVTLEPSESSQLTAKGAALMRYFLLQSRTVLSPAHFVERKTVAATGTRKLVPIEMPKQFEQLPLRLTAGTKSEASRTRKK